MTPRERVIAAIDHRQPDRVPIALRFAPELRERLMEKLAVDTTEQLDSLLGQDMVNVRPRFTAAVSDVSYADPTIEISPQGHLLDIFRVPFRLVETDCQKYVELVGQAPLADCKSVDDLAKFSWPEPCWWDYSDIERELQANSTLATCGHSRGFFEIAHFMRGMDNFMMDLSADPDFACAVMDHIIDYLIEKSKRILEAGNGRFDIFEYNDDIASQRNLLISPEMWRKYIKPRMARFCELFHSYGAKVKYHSCGSCYKIIDDLIEIGVDILNPIQPLAAEMDPFDLKRQFGERLCFFGGIDIQQILPNSSAEEVFEHVREVIEVVGKDGGYILAGSHTIQNDTPVENVLAMVAAAKGV